MFHFYRCLMIIACMLGFFELKAQRYAFDQGSIRLGIVLSYANYGGEFYQPNLTALIEADRITEFAIRPNLAYFFFEGLAIGAELSYTTITQNDKNNVVTLFSQTSWSIGPNVSYFFGERRSPVFPFLSASYAYQESSEQEFESQRKSRFTGTRIRASGGMAIMFGKQASLNVEAFYRIDQRRVNSAKKSGNVFGLEVGASLYIF